MAATRIDPDSPGGRVEAASVMPAAEPGSGTARLDRRRILGAAIAMIDQEGLRSLTDLDGYPLLKRLQPQLSEDRSAETFADSLELLIDRSETLGTK